MSKLQGYRTLALNRGEKQGIIKVNFKHNLEKMHRFYSARFKQKNDYIEEVINPVSYTHLDVYKRQV